MKILICFKCMWCGQPTKVSVTGTATRDVHIFADEYRTCDECKRRLYESAGARK